MNNKHFAFIVYLMDLRPTEMMSFTGPLESENAKVIDAKVQLISTMILHGENK